MATFGSQFYLWSSSGAQTLVYPGRALFPSPSRLFVTLVRVMDHRFVEISVCYTTEKIGWCQIER